MTQLATVSTIAKWEGRPCPKPLSMIAIQSANVAVDETSRRNYEGLILPIRSITHPCRTFIHVCLWRSEMTAEKSKQMVRPLRVFVGHGTKAEQGFHSRKSMPTPEAIAPGSCARARARPDLSRRAHDCRPGVHELLYRGLRGVEGERYSEHRQGTGGSHVGYRS